MNKIILGTSLLLFCFTLSATDFRLGVYGRSHWNGGLTVDQITDYNGIAAACGINVGDVEHRRKISKHAPGRCFYS